LNQVLKGIDFTFVNPFGQALDVGRRQVRSKEGNTENDQKLQMAEQKMGELLSAMGVLGKEAAAAMTSVEAQQQRLTLQRLISMVSFTISA
jgi:Holliday junction resolvasome RuvABC DNA-binding subunit